MKNSKEEILTPEIETVPEIIPNLIPERELVPETWPDEAPLPKPKA